MKIFLVKLLALLILWFVPILMLYGLYVFSTWGDWYPGDWTVEGRTAITIGWFLYIIITAPLTIEIIS